MIAAGPDFKKGMISSIPSCNVDLAPTVLHLLGLPQTSPPMDGRVLHEALVAGRKSTAEPQTKTIEATRDLGLHQWRQYLKITHYGDATYLDEGNGESTPK